MVKISLVLHETNEEDGSGYEISNCKWPLSDALRIQSETRFEFKPENNTITKGGFGRVSPFLAPFHTASLPCFFIQRHFARSSCFHRCKVVPYNLW